MSRVITFSRTFPSYHLKRGEPTYFVEQIWNGLNKEWMKIVPHSLDYFNAFPWVPEESYKRALMGPKFHTIRAGNRWKVGDKFSPRVWSGKPYQSKQIIIAPDIEVKMVRDFTIWAGGYTVNGEWIGLDELTEIAKNDGLEVDDLELWFAPYAKKEDCHCQIICWNERIEY